MILALKACRSPGLREVITPWSTTPSESSHFAPALLTSVLIDLKDVILRPLAMPVSIRSHGPWQTAATTFFIENVFDELKRLGLDAKQIGIDLPAGQHNRVVVTGRDLVLSTFTGRPQSFLSQP